MNTSVPWPDLAEAETRVLVMQTKLHNWAKADPGRRFDDLFNLVHDPAFLVVAWRRVRGNKGARTAGVDGVTPRSIGPRAAALLARLRAELKARRFAPQRVREKAIPKASGKIRRLGIPTTADRIVQASLKLVLEPIFEAEFQPCSYGFRPRRRAQDALAEIHYLGSPSRNYHWVFEADIKACFDEIDHTALMGRVRRRIGDKRILALVKAFLRAGLLSEEGVRRETITGTPQGGILRWRRPRRDPSGPRRGAASPSDEGGRLPDPQHQPQSRTGEWCSQQFWRLQWTRRRELRHRRTRPSHLIPCEPASPDERSDSRAS